MMEEASQKNETENTKMYQVSFSQASHKFFPFFSPFPHSCVIRVVKNETIFQVSNEQ